MYQHRNTNASVGNSTDYYVDNKTGFVTPQLPLQRLRGPWKVWEATLQVARSQRLKTAGQSSLLDAQQKAVEVEKSQAWRKSVEKMPVLSTDKLIGCERELRRAHHVLAFAVQFYAHTVPLADPITIPRSLSIPLLRVSKELQHAPFITYFDHALDNWSYKEACNELALPTAGNIMATTTFTGTTEENDLYMIDLHLELEGAKALGLLRSIMEEILGSSDPDTARIAESLHQVAIAIERMKEALMSTMKHITPETFYHEISPWMKGPESDPSGRTWLWEGSEEVECSAEMLSNTNTPTAGQSPTIPSIDAYLSLGEDVSKSAFLDRVRVYMLRPHGAYLQHLRHNGSPIRSFIETTSQEQGTSSAVVVAYDAAVRSMKSLRDSHLAIVSKYVIVPSRKAQREVENMAPGTATRGKFFSPNDDIVGPKAQRDKNTSGEGAILMKFLKGFRDQTERAYIG